MPPLSSLLLVHSYVLLLFITRFSNVALNTLSHNKLGIPVPPAPATLLLHLIG
jgi:hypothetical protein